MPRIRSIKPELPHDAKLAKCSRGARYAFILLLTQADDQGYFRASPRLLLGQLYPHDADVTEAILVGWMDELLRAGLLAAYDSGDGPLGHIVNFLKHQKIDHASKVYLANLSRKPRATFAIGVLSLEPRVLSLDSDAIASETAVSRPESPAEKPQLPVDIGHGQNESVGAFYGRCLKTVCWPQPVNGTSQRERESRDISVLNRQLKTRRREEIVLAATELRRQADAGDLAGFIEPRDGFGLRALFGNANGGVTLFERFLHDAHKRAEHNGKHERSQLEPLTVPDWGMEHA